MANTDWPDLKFIVDWLITNSTDNKYLNLLFALQYFVFLQKDLATFTTNEGWSLTLEERLILGKYREAPRIDYGVKHKASLLIMHIYTCVLMLYKGRPSRTPPVYSLFIV